MCFHGLIAFLFATFLAAGLQCTSLPRFTTSRDAKSAFDGSHQLSGTASYYADEFHGRTTANGETFDMDGLTAAHRTLPFNTVVMVKNQENGREVVVRINDRGPFKDDRVIDLSYEAAKRISLVESGTARVVLEVIEMGIER